MLALSILTPPFQVPDEQQHFFRAYQISVLGLVGTVENGKAGAVLPSSLIELSEQFLGSRELHADRRISPAPLSETVQALRTPLNAERTEFIEFFGAAFYSPLPYLAQAGAIAVGRTVGLGPLGLLYIARMANGFTAALIVSLALALIPTGAIALLVFALLPMTIYMFASVSPDAAVIANALLYTAVATRARARNAWRGREIAIACLTAADFLTVKPVYAPLLVLGLPFQLRYGSAVNAVRAYATILFVALGAVLAWFAYAKASIVVPMTGTAPARQILTILASPLSYGRVLLRSVVQFGPSWFKQLVGVLGWLTVTLPVSMYVVPPISLGLCAILPRREGWGPGLLELLWYLAVVLSSALLIMTALYAYWSNLGSSIVLGVQGRYFLPLAGVLAIIVESRIPILQTPSAGWVKYSVFVVSFVEAVSTCLLVISAYNVL